MISKLRFSLIAVIMLVLLGFGFQDQAKGQIGLNGLFCPAVPDTTGWLETEIVGSGLVIPDFRGGLIGTVENSGAAVVGGLDWQHVDHTEFPFTPTPTNEVGSQLISWWTQKDGRNTYLQVTNANAGAVTVHVRFHNENCVEIRDFCDTYTPNDTHQYNLGDLFSNTGNDIADANLQNVEGFVTITPVTDCGSDNEFAHEHNHMSGQLVVHDSSDYLYGVNMYTRWGICFDFDIDTEVNHIANGSFQNGEANWDEEQEFAEVIDPMFEIDPEQEAPPNPYDSPNAAFVISAPFDPADSNDCYEGGSFDNLDTCDLANIGNDDDQNVAVWESDLFNRTDDCEDEMSFNLQLYTGDSYDGGDVCNNYAAVLLIRDDGDGDGTIIDGTCYQEEDVEDLGDIDSEFDSSKDCIELADSDDDIAFRNFEFNGRTGFQLGEELDFDGFEGQFRVQVVTAQNVDDDDDCNDSNRPVGALVNNFQAICTETETIVCDGTLDGSFNAMLDNIHPETLAGQFNILPANASAGADVVLINFADQYGPPYRPIAAFSAISVSIFDEDEVDQSCGDALVCFTRLGIDDALILSENFAPATPTPTPTVTPTITPTPPTLPPTLPPTNNPSGGSSSCAIAGNPVQLGTALANVLIPLVPVAFAFGVRAVRRRKK